jgi:NHLM bacteriocin system ABC transporter ATP-binding protein
MNSLHLSSNSRFFLDTEEEVWIVEKGEGELFAMEQKKKADHGMGPLLFLHHISQGSLLIGFPPAKLSLLLLTTSPVRLKKIPRTQFSHENGKNRELIEQWVQLFSPLTQRLHQEEISCDVEHFWDKLPAFQKKILSLLHHDIEAKSVETAEKNQQREEVNARAVEESLKKLADTLHKEQPLTLSKLPDPLLRACQIIGNQIGVTFRLEGGKETSSYFEKIREICRTSDVRYRKVKLTHAFWKEDVGPLLAFYNEKPVALLRTSSHRYEMIDPITEERKILDEDLAADLSQSAFTFYPPFPVGELSGLAIARFCLSRRLREILTIIAIGAGGAFISLLPPFLNRFLFDDVIGSNEQDLLWQIISGLIVIATSSALFLFARSYGVLKIMQIVDLKLESALWDRILNLPAHFFRQFTVGNLVQRIYSISSIREMVGQNAVKVLLSGLFSLFYFLAMLYYSRSLALIGIIVIFFSILISALCIAIKVSIERRILAIDGDLRGILIQIITGISKLRLCAAENRAFAHWAGCFSESKFLQIKAQKYQNVVTTLTAILPIFSNALLFTAAIFILAKSLADNIAIPLSIGSFIAFMAAYVPFSQAVFDAVNTLIGMASSLPLWERAEVILNAAPESSALKTKPGRLTGNMLVDHVSFRYEKDSPLILNNVTIEAKSGQMVAIVGPTGCGKSTLVRLLLGFEKPELGSITYDEKDLSELDLREVRRQIGTVLQNGSLLSGSLYENIVCGGIYTMEEVEAAIRLSGFEEDLEQLPMGLQTVVQSGGGSFSVGQAQRLLICRALISQPTLLLFDEATSALDNKTQEMVSNNLTRSKQRA